MAGDDFKSWAVWGPIIITLLSGTVSSLGNKIAFDTPVEGTCGKNKFGKAYFFTLAMFIGEAMCLGLYYAKQWRAKRRVVDAYSALDHEARLSPVQSGLNQPFNVASGVSPVPLEPVLAAPKPKIWVYAVLSCFDLSATAISGVGLLWVDASTNQMLRGSMVVFCAIFSVILLKRRLSRGQWGSIGVVVLGLVMVGLKQQLEQKYETPECPAGADSSKPSGGQVLIGIILVLAGSALNAIQNVLEEKLMKGAEVDPLELVGWEGVFGLALSSFVLMPIVQHIPGDDCGHAEDTLNTLKQLGNSPLVLCMVLSYIVGLMFMNWTSQQITQQLSSVHRNLVSAVRTVLVWVCMLILYYSTSHSPCDNTVANYGEKWTVWSVLELGGFAVLVGGTILYSYCGILLARQQENEEQIRGQFNSPDYVLPIEPTLAEHQQIVKQQSFSNKMHNAGYQSHQ